LTPSYQILIRLQQIVAGALDDSLPGRANCQSGSDRDISPYFRYITFFRQDLPDFHQTPNFTINPVILLILSGFTLSVVRA